MSRIAHRSVGVLLSLLVAAALAAPAAAVEVVYLEQEVTTAPVMGQGGQTTLQKMWIGEGRFRVEDQASGVVTILRTDTGRVYLIDPSERAYSEMTLDQLRKLASMGMAMLQQMSQGKGAAEATVTETGETAKIGPWTARKVQLRLTGPMPLDATIWLSDDVDIGMREWTQVMEMLQMQGVLGGALDKLMALDGYPVRQETTLTMMGTSVTSSSELKKATRVPVEAAFFEPPAGYTKNEDMLPAEMPSGMGR